jgi:hypothetical protein
MVAVVVDHEDAFGLALDLEAALDAGERFQPLGVLAKGISSSSATATAASCATP